MTFMLKKHLMHRSLGAPGCQDTMWVHDTIRHWMCVRNDGSRRGHTARIGSHWLMFGSLNVNITQAKESHVHQVSCLTFKNVDINQPSKNLRFVPDDRWECVGVDRARAAHKPHGAKRRTNCIEGERLARSAGCDHLPRTF